MMARQITDVGLEIIKRNEGVRLAAYRDVVGVLTIGYGHTGDVGPDDTITAEQAEDILREDLARFESAVDLATQEYDTTDAQRSAMVSLAFNIGTGAFKGSTVLRRHQAGDYQGAADAFLMWDKAGGQVVPGLLRRRYEERALYLSEPALDRQSADQAPETAVPDDNGGVLGWIKSKLFGAG